MSSQFNASYPGIGDMLKSPEMQAEMMRRAEKVKARAEATAPYDPTSKDGTHYRDSFAVVATPREDRAQASVVNTDAAAFYIEWGSKTVNKYRTLGRALDAAAD